jgi:uncharacterized protein involved in exopolysaccharide biosynthesis
MQEEELREGMTFADLVRVLWRRKVAVVVTTAVVVALGGGWVMTQAPRFRSTATLALTPSGGDSFTLLSQVNTIIPLYAEAIKARETSQIAQAQLHTSRLGAVSVRTFRDAPIIKLDATSSDPRVAYQTAQAIADALIVRLKRGEVGLTNVRVLEVDRPIVPEDPVWPLPKLTLIIAGVLGLGLGVALGLFIEQLQGRAEARSGRSRIREPRPTPRRTLRSRRSVQPEAQGTRGALSDLEQAAEQVMRLTEAAPRRDGGVGQISRRPDAAVDARDEPSNGESAEERSRGSVRRLLRPDA